AVVQHHVDAVLAGRVASGIVDGNALITDGQRSPEGDRRVVTIERKLAAPCALRQLRDLGLRGRLRAREDEACELVQRIELELLHHLHEAARARLVRGDVRKYVSFDLKGGAHVLAQQDQQV